jgi:hypothetical protein
LEEVDQLFDARIWAWQFKGYKTTGTAGFLTEVENMGKKGAEEADDVEQGPQAPDRREKV